jgi:hypothetical protein
MGADDGKTLTFSMVRQLSAWIGYRLLHGGPVWDHTAAFFGQYPSASAGFSIIDSCLSASTELPLRGRRAIRTGHASTLVISLESRNYHDFSLAAPRRRAV